jgi:hypothetical protein
VIKFPRIFLQIFVATMCVTTIANAQTGRKNPKSKLYVADEVGDSQIDTGKEIDDLTKKSVFNAEGTEIETKANSNVSIVLSNGTGIYCDVSTRVKINTFQQEAFRPNRTDVEDEPSISTTHLLVEHGVIGVSTSKLVAGSKMVYDTPLASATIHGRQAVIQSLDNMTVISMYQGEATVQAGPMDRPREVNNRQQIIVTPGKPGELNHVVIQDIPAGQDEDRMRWVDAARKLVYFEVQARKSADGEVTLFDGAAATGPGTETGNSEIVPVPVVPNAPPVVPNVSPANLTRP